MIRGVIKCCIILLVILLIVNSGLCQVTDKNISSISSIISGAPRYNNDTNTNVSVIKTIDGSNGYPNLIYKIKIPKVDYYDFVLALDSSGSFSYGGDVSQAHAVAGAVPNFIKDITTNDRYKTKQLNLTIVSFNDNISFIYNSLNSINPFKSNESSNVKLVSAKRLSDDIDKYPVFGNNTKNYYYYANEMAGTNLSSPINASINILDNIKQDRFHRISKFVILVTGKSEFTPVQKRLIEKAKQKNYSIYIIALDLKRDENDAKSMVDNLMELAGYPSDIVDRIQFLPTPPDPKYLENDLLAALIEALQNATSAPVANDVTIFESFYNYIDPGLYSSIQVNGSLNKITPIGIAINNQTNADKPNIIAFRLKEGLDPESETIVTIPTSLHLEKLPVSIGEDSKNVTLATISKDTPRSYLSYSWMDGYNGNINLVEDKINIDTESPKKQTASTPATPGIWSILAYLFGKI